MKRLLVLAAAAFMCVRISAEGISRGYGGVELGMSIEETKSDN